MVRYVANVTFVGFGIFGVLMLLWAAHLKLACEAANPDAHCFVHVMAVADPTP